MQLNIYLTCSFLSLITIPLILAETALQRLKNATTVEKFVELLQRNGQPIRLEDLYPYGTTEDNQTTGEIVYVSGGFNLALPDECSPRETAVPVPRQPQDSAEFVYWPECTKVKRCGGCCPSNRLTCVADRVETVSFHVLRAKAREEGSHYLDWIGPIPVGIEQHVSCKLACKMSSSDCEPYQHFVLDECSCECNDRPPCNPSQIWDNELCTCRCPTQLHPCTANTVYDTTTCDCEIYEETQEQNIAINHVVSQEEINAYLQASNEQNAEVETTAPTTTTTVRTTTTEAPRPPAQDSVCAHTNCPPFWKKIPTPHGCRCQPRFL